MGGAGGSARLAVSCLVKRGPAQLAGVRITPPQPWRRSDPSVPRDAVVP